MSNVLYTAAKEGFLAGEIDWDTAVIKAALVRGYSPSVTHKFVSDVTAASGVLTATSGALASKTVTGGTGDAADITFIAVAANAVGHGLLVFQASAVGGGADVATSLQRLICYFDTGTNLPIFTNGSDVVVTWNASGIFTI